VFFSNHVRNRELMIQVHGMFPFISKLLSSFSPIIRVSPRRVKTWVFSATASLKVMKSGELFHNAHRWKIQARFNLRAWPFPELTRQHFLPGR
jgi:hypothetical protein